jgi:hypothetical protein
MELEPCGWENPRKCSEIVFITLVSQPTEKSFNKMAGDLPRSWIGQAIESDIRTGHRGVLVLPETTGVGSDSRQWRKAGRTWIGTGLKSVGGLGHTRSLE